MNDSNTGMILSAYDDYITQCVAYMDGKNVEEYKRPQRQDLLDFFLKNRIIKKNVETNAIEDIQIPSIDDTMKHFAI